MTEFSTADPAGARAHARAMAGLRVESQPTVPASAAEGTDAILADGRTETMAGSTLVARTETTETASAITPATAPLSAGQGAAPGPRAATSADTAPFLAGATEVSHLLGSGEPAPPPAEPPSASPRSELASGIMPATAGTVPSSAEAPAPPMPAHGPPAYGPPPSPARQVAPVAVALSLLGGERPSLRIALEPAELGRVEIRIERSAEGDAVRILAERPETLALLQRDQRELGRALDQAGVQRGEGGLSFGLAGQDAAGGGAAGGQGGTGARHGGALRHHAAVEAMPPPMPVPVRGGSLALLDISA